MYNYTVRLIIYWTRDKNDIIHFCVDELRTFITQGRYYVVLCHFHLVKSIFSRMRILTLLNVSIS